MASDFGRRAAPHWARRLLTRRVSFWQGQALAVVAVLCAALLRFALTPLVGDGLPFVTFLPAVLIAGLLAGALAGATALSLASVVASLAWLNWSSAAQAGVDSWLRLLVFWILCALIIMSAALLRALVGALRASEERATLLAHETTHKMRNVLGVAQSISRQTSRAAASWSDYHTLFEARLAALGWTQELIADSPETPVDLRSLLERTLEPFGADRFSLSGDATSVPRQEGSTLALLIHELGANALKFGALCVAEGRIDVVWAIGDDDIEIRWRERNGPPVATPSRRGFGSRLMRTAFAPGRGAAHLAFEPDGLRCRIRIAVGGR